MLCIVDVQTCEHCFPGYSTVTSASKCHT